MQANVPEPKDIVLVIDKSGSMNTAFSGSGTGYTVLMNIAKEAAKTVVSTLNPHDRVSSRHRFEKPEFHDKNF